MSLPREFLDHYRVGWNDVLYCIQTWHDSPLQLMVWCKERMIQCHELCEPYRVSPQQAAYCRGVFDCCQRFLDGESQLERM